MKGREDDNIETIRKRFNVFLESSLPVVQYYEAKGKVRKVIFCLPIFILVIRFSIILYVLAVTSFLAFTFRLMLQSLLQRFLMLLKLFLPQKMRR